MTLLLVFFHPNTGHMGYSVVGSEWLEPEDFDYDGVIYVGY